MVRGRGTPLALGRLAHLAGAILEVAVIWVVTKDPAELEIDLLAVLLVEDPATAFGRAVLLDDRRERVQGSAGVEDRPAATVDRFVPGQDRGLERKGTEVGNKEFKGPF